MSELKKPKQDKKLSLHPLQFQEALKGLLETEPPLKEKKDKQAPKKWRGKVSENNK